MNNFGYVVIIFAMTLVAVDFYRERPSGGRIVGLTSLVLVLCALGYAIINQDSVTEASFGQFGSIRKAAKQAVIDAKTVSELKDRVQVQSASIDAVAEQAKRAGAISTEAEQEIARVRGRMSMVNKDLDVLSRRIKQLEVEAAYATEVQAATSDSRRDFEKLLERAYSSNDPFQSKALASASAIAFAHNQANITSYSGVWNQGLDTNSLSFDELVEKFQTANEPASRLSIIQFVNRSNKISLLWKASFDVGVVKYSLSLNEIETAVRGLDANQNLTFGALNVEGVLDWWSPPPIKSNVVLDFDRVRTWSGKPW